MRESSILEFWTIKHLINNPKDLLNKAVEAYTEDFVSNFSFWKESLKDLNKNIEDYLLSMNFDMSVFIDMTFDEFCKIIIDNIKEWIKLNKDLTPNDIKLIIEIIIETHLKKIVGLKKEKEKLEKEKEYTINNLFNSIKKTIYKKDATD